MDLFDTPPSTQELVDAFSYQPQHALQQSYQGHDYLMWFWKMDPSSASTVYFTGYLLDRAEKKGWSAIVDELIQMKAPLRTFQTMGRVIDPGLAHLHSIPVQSLLFKIVLYALQEKDQFTTTRRETEDYKSALEDMVQTFGSLDGAFTYSENGAQVLHLLMSTKYKDLVGNVLDRMDDATINQRVSSRQNTWAHEAVIAKSTSALQWFAQHRPDILDIPNNDGQTPAQLAVEMQQTNLLRYMKPHNPVVNTTVSAASDTGVSTPASKRTRISADDQYSLF